jgi:hypothetical protein
MLTLIITLSAITLIEITIVLSLPADTKKRGNARSAKGKRT